MSEIDPVHIDDSHPCVPHIVQAADAVVKALRADTLLAMYLSCDVLDALAAYEKIRGGK